jgi:hypothetical protein
VGEAAEGGEERLALHDMKLDITDEELELITKSTSVSQSDVALSTSYRVHSH